MFSSVFPMKHTHRKPYDSNHEALVQIPYGSNFPAVKRPDSQGFHMSP